jgi:hypothetical protein
MVQRGWEAHVLGQAPNTFTDALTAVKTLRVRGGCQGAAQPAGAGAAAAACCSLLQPAAAGPAAPARLAPPRSRPPPTPASPCLRPLQGTEEAPVSDQFVDPFVIVGEDSKPVGGPAALPC